MSFFRRQFTLGHYRDKVFMIVRRTVRKLRLRAAGREAGKSPLEMRVLAALLAVALQIQATLPVGGSGLRVAVSDLLLPFFLLYVALWLLTSSSKLEWRMPGVVWWLAAITLAMTVALLIGYERLGRWSAWALLNKWGGWLALVSYFVIGGAIVRSGGINLRAEFLRTLFISAAVIALLNVLAMPWLLLEYTLPIGVEFNRATGGMKNANAFGFLMTVLALLVVAIEKDTRVYLPPLLAALWFSSSRGALLAFAVGALTYLLLSPRRLVPALKASAIALLAIVAITTISVVIDPSRLADVRSGRAPLGFLSIERLDPEAATIRERQAQNQRAVNLFAQAPIFGQGLGYFVATTGITLHNSLLWLIIETGIAGAAVFTGFLALAVRSLCLGREDPYLLGMVAVSFAFVVMSITGEFLYQRHLWLLLGMALATMPAARGPA